MEMRATMAIKDYYALLGVSPGASQEEIKRAYRSLAKRYHPDKNRGDPASEEKLKEINEAYQILGDRGKRREYDFLFQRPRKHYIFVEDDGMKADPVWQSSQAATDMDLINLLWKLSRSGFYKTRPGNCRRKGFGRGCRGRRRFFFDDVFD